ncbi:MAG: DUF2254 domain-containing protein [Nocardioides sp.]
MADHVGHPGGPGEPEGGARVRNRLRTPAEQARASFWFWPAVLMAAAVVFAWLLGRLDAAHDGTWAGLLFNGGPDGARALLGTIAASMVTVGTTVFSITMVALTLASQQFGPRMLASFIRDRGNQVTIGVFLAVFVYAMLVLRTVANDRPVPNLSVSAAVVAAVGAVLVLVYFIHHIASSIQVMHLVDELGDDLLDHVDALFRPRCHPGMTAGSDAAQDEPTGPGQPVPAPGDGYVRLVDVGALIATAAAHDLVVRLDVRPGRFVVAGQPIGRLYGLDGAPARVPDDVAHEFARTVAVGSQRSATQDAEFPLMQLVEVALRALSPGINDPITATACVNRLSVALCRLTASPEPATALADDQGRVRVLLSEPITFARLVGSAYDQIRQAAEGHVVVYVHLLDALTRVAACTVDPDRLAAVLAQAHLVVERAEQAVPQEADRAVLRQRHDALLATAGVSSGAPA